MVTDRTTEGENDEVNISNIEITTESSKNTYFAWLNNGSSETGHEETSTSNVKENVAENKESLESTTAGSESNSVNQGIQNDSTENTHFAWFKGFFGIENTESKSYSAQETTQGNTYISSLNDASWRDSTISGSETYSIMSQENQTTQNENKEITKFAWFHSGPSELENSETTTFSAQEITQSNTDMSSLNYTSWKDSSTTGSETNYLMSPKQKTQNEGNENTKFAWFHDEGSSESKNAESTTFSAQKITQGNTDISSSSEISYITSTTNQKIQSEDKENTRFAWLGGSPKIQNEESYRAKETTHENNNNSTFDTMKFHSGSENNLFTSEMNTKVTFNENYFSDEMENTEGNDMNGLMELSTEGATMIMFLTEGSTNNEILDQLGFNDLLQTEEDSFDNLFKSLKPIEINLNSSPDVNENTATTVSSNPLFSNDKITNISKLTIEKFLNKSETVTPTLSNSEIPTNLSTLYSPFKVNDFERTTSFLNNEKTTDFKNIYLKNTATTVSSNPLFSNDKITNISKLTIEKNFNKSETLTPTLSNLEIQTNLSTLYSSFKGNDFERTTNFLNNEETTDFKNIYLNKMYSENEDKNFILFLTEKSTEENDILNDLGFEGLLPSENAIDDILKTIMPIEINLNGINNENIESLDSYTITGISEKISTESSDYAIKKISSHENNTLGTRIANINTQLNNLSVTESQNGQITPDYKNKESMMPSIGIKTYNSNFERKSTELILEVTRQPGNLQSDSMINKNTEKLSNSLVGNEKSNSIPETTVAVQNIITHNTNIELGLTELHSEITRQPGSLESENIININTEKLPNGLVATERTNSITETNVDLLNIITHNTNIELKPSEFHSEVTRQPGSLQSESIININTEKLPNGLIANERINSITETNVDLLNIITHNTNIELKPSEFHSEVTRQPGSLQSESIININTEKLPNGLIANERINSITETNIEVQNIITHNANIEHKTTELHSEVTRQPGSLESESIININTEKLPNGLVTNERINSITETNIEVQNIITHNANIEHEPTEFHSEVTRQPGSLQSESIININTEKLPNGLVANERTNSITETNIEVQNIITHNANIEHETTELHSEVTRQPGSLESESIININTEKLPNGLVANEIINSITETNIEVQNIITHNTNIELKPTEFLSEVTKQPGNLQSESILNINTEKLPNGLVANETTHYITETNIEIQNIITHNANIEHEPTELHSEVTRQPGSLQSESIININTEKLPNGLVANEKINSITETTVAVQNIITHNTNIELKPTEFLSEVTKQPGNLQSESILNINTEKLRNGLVANETTNYITETNIEIQNIITHNANIEHEPTELHSEVTRQPGSLQSESIININTEKLPNGLVANERTNSITETNIEVQNIVTHNTNIELKPTELHSEVTQQPGSLQSESIININTEKLPNGLVANERTNYITETNIEVQNIVTHNTNIDLKPTELHSEVTGQPGSLHSESIINKNTEKLSNGLVANEIINSVTETNEGLQNIPSHNTNGELRPTEVTTQQESLHSNSMYNTVTEKPTNLFANAKTNSIEETNEGVTNRLTQMSVSYEQTTPRKNLVGEEEATTAYVINTEKPNSVLPKTENVSEYTETINRNLDNTIKYQQNTVLQTEHLQFTTKVTEEEEEEGDYSGFNRKLTLTSDNINEPDKEIKLRLTDLDLQTITEELFRNRSDYAYTLGTHTENTNDNNRTHTENTNDNNRTHTENTIDNNIHFFENTTHEITTNTYLDEEIQSQTKIADKEVFGFQQKDNQTICELCYNFEEIKTDSFRVNSDYTTKSSAVTEINTLGSENGNIEPTVLITGGTTQQESLQSNSMISIVTENANSIQETNGNIINMITRMSLFFKDLFTGNTTNAMTTKNYSDEEIESQTRIADKEIFGFQQKDDQTICVTCNDYEEIKTDNDHTTKTSKSTETNALGVQNTNIGPTELISEGTTTQGSLQSNSMISIVTEKTNYIQETNGSINNMTTRMSPHFKDLFTGSTTNAMATKSYSDEVNENQIKIVDNEVFGFQPKDDQTICVTCNNYEELKTESENENSQITKNNNYTQEINTTQINQQLYSNNMTLQTISISNLNNIVTETSNEAFSSTLELLNGKQNLASTYLQNEFVDKQSSLQIQTHQQNPEVNINNNSYILNTELTKSIPLKDITTNAQTHFENTLSTAAENVVQLNDQSKVSGLSDNQSPSEKSSESNLLTKLSTQQLEHNYNKISEITTATESLEHFDVNKLINDNSVEFSTARGNKTMIIFLTETSTEENEETNQLYEDNETSTKNIYDSFIKTMAPLEINLPDETTSNSGVPQNISTATAIINNALVNEEKFNETSTKFNSVSEITSLVNENSQTFISSSNFENISGTTNENLFSPEIIANSIQSKQTVTEQNNEGTSFTTSTNTITNTSSTSTLLEETQKITTNIEKVDLNDVVFNNSLEFKATDSMIMILTEASKGTEMVEDLGIGDTFLTEEPYGNLLKTMMPLEINLSNITHSAVSDNNLTTNNYTQSDSILQKSSVSNMYNNTLGSSSYTNIEHQVTQASSILENMKELTTQTKHDFTETNLLSNSELVVHKSTETNMLTNTLESPFYTNTEHTMIQPLENMNASTSQTNHDFSETNLHSNSELVVHKSTETNMLTNTLEKSLYTNIEHTATQTSSALENMNTPITQANHYFTETNLPTNDEGVLQKSSDTNLPTIALGTPFYTTIEHKEAQTSLELENTLNSQTKHDFTETNLLSDNVSNKAQNVTQNVMSNTLKTNIDDNEKEIGIRRTDLKLQTLTESHLEDSSLLKEHYISSTHIMNNNTLSSMYQLLNTETESELQNEAVTHEKSSESIRISVPKQENITQTNNITKLDENNVSNENRKHLQGLVTNVEEIKLTNEETDHTKPSEKETATETQNISKTEEQKAKPEISHSESNVGTILESSTTSENPESETKNLSNIDFKDITEPEYTSDFQLSPEQNVNNALTSLSVTTTVESQTQSIPHNNNENNELYSLQITSESQPHQLNSEVHNNEEVFSESHDENSKLTIANTETIYHMSENIKEISSNMVTNSQFTEIVNNYELSKNITTSEMKSSNGSFINEHVSENVKESHEHITLGRNFVEVEGATITNVTTTEKLNTELREHLPKMESTSEYIQTNKEINLTNLNVTTKTYLDEEIESQTGIVDKEVFGFQQKNVQTICEICDKYEEINTESGIGINSELTTSNNYIQNTSITQVNPQTHLTDLNNMVSFTTTSMSENEVNILLTTNNNHTQITNTSQTNPETYLTELNNMVPVTTNSISENEVNSQLTTSNNYTQGTSTINLTELNSVVEFTRTSLNENEVTSQLTTSNNYKQDISATQINPETYLTELNNMVPVTTNSVNENEVNSQLTTSNNYTQGTSTINLTELNSVVEFTRTSLNENEVTSQLTTSNNYTQDISTTQINPETYLTELNNMVPVTTNSVNENEVNSQFTTNNDYTQNTSTINLTELNSMVAFTRTSLNGNEVTSQLTTSNNYTQDISTTQINPETYLTGLNNTVPVATTSISNNYTQHTNTTNLTELVNSMIPFTTAGVSGNEVNSQLTSTTEINQQTNLTELKTMIPFKTTVISNLQPLPSNESLSNEQPTSGINSMGVEGATITHFTNTANLYTDLTEHLSKTENTTENFETIKETKLIQQGYSLEKPTENTKNENENIVENSSKGITAKANLDEEIESQTRVADKEVFGFQQKDGQTICEICDKYEEIKTESEYEVSSQLTTSNNYTHDTSTTQTNLTELNSTIPFKTTGISNLQSVPSNESLINEHTSENMKEYHEQTTPGNKSVEAEGATTTNANTEKLNTELREQLSKIENATEYFETKLTDLVTEESIPNRSDYAYTLETHVESTKSDNKIFLESTTMGITSRTNLDEEIESHTGVVDKEVFGFQQTGDQTICEICDKYEEIKTEGGNEVSSQLTDLNHTISHETTSVGNLNLQSMTEESFRNVSTQTTFFETKKTEFVTEIQLKENEYISNTEHLTRRLLEIKEQKTVIDNTKLGFTPKYDKTIHITSTSPEEHSSFSSKHQTEHKSTTTSIDQHHKQVEETDKTHSPKSVTSKNTVQLGDEVSRAASSTTYNTDLAEKELITLTETISSNIGVTEKHFISFTEKGDDEEEGIDDQQVSVPPTIIWQQTTTEKCNATCGSHICNTKKHPTDEKDSVVIILDGLNDTNVKNLHGRHFKFVKEDENGSDEPTELETEPVTVVDILHQNLSFPPYVKGYCTEEDIERGSNCICSTDNMVDVLTYNLTKKISLNITKCPLYLHVSDTIVIGKNAKAEVRVKRSHVFTRAIDIGKEISNEKDIDIILAEDEDIHNSDIRNFVLCNSEVIMPCVYSSEVLENNNSHQLYYSWIRSDGKEVKDNIRETDGSMVISNVSSQHSDNYTCFVKIIKNDVEKAKYLHEITVMELPLFKIKKSLIYEMNVPCTLSEGDVLYTYLPKVLGELLCGFVHSSCKVELLRPICLNERNSHLINVTIIVILEKLKNLLPLAESNCNIHCRLKMQSKLGKLFMDNVEKVANIKVDTHISQDIKYTPVSSKTMKRSTNNITSPISFVMGCPAGFGVQPPFKKICSACSRGTYNPDERSVCVRCAAGYYQPTPGSTVCILCRSPLDNPDCLRVLYTNTGYFGIYVATAFGFVLLLLLAICIYIKMDGKSDSHSGFCRNPSDVNMQKKRKYSANDTEIQPLIEPTKGRRNPPEIPPVDF